MKTCYKKLFFVLIFFQGIFQAYRAHRTAVLTHKHTNHVKRHLYIKLRLLGCPRSQARDIIKNSSHVVTTYVDFIQSAGSDPLFLEFNSSWNEQLKILEKADAVLLPGGDMPLIKKDLEDNGKINRINPANPGEYILHVGDILDKVRELNKERERKQKDLINVLGICLGFEAMLFYDSEYTLRYTNMNRKHMMDVVLFKEEPGAQPPAHEISNAYRQLKLEYNRIANLFDHNEITKWEKGHYAFYNHRKGITTKQFYKAKNIKNIYRIAATFPYEEHDGVAIIEGKLDPFFGVQFHPERAAFERYNSFHLKGPTYKKYLNRKFATLLTDQKDRSVPSAGKIHGFRKADNYYMIDVENISIYKRITVVSKSPDISIFKELQDRRHKTYI